MFTGNIYAVAVRSNGRILVGGAFTDFNGVGRSGIVELNPDGTIASDSNTGSGTGTVMSVLPLAGERNVGIVVMCAVRSVLVKPAAVEAYVRQWEDEGLLKPGVVEPQAALDWLVDEHAPTVSAAAYKFAARHPAVGSVLTGTANLDHFDANMQAILGPPLDENKYQRVLDVFGPVQRNVQPERSGRRRV